LRYVSVAEFAGVKRKVDGSSIRHGPFNHAHEMRVEPEGEEKT
jgi:hypothetical protein